MQQFLLSNQESQFNKPLPHNFLAEKMILSCLLINSEAIELTVQKLPIQAFYFRNHQEIYKSISIMHKNKSPVDVLTLLNFLQDNGLLYHIGGVKVLIELISQIPNLVYLEEYIRLVQEKFIRRSLIQLGYEIVNSGYITNITLETILKNFEDRLFKLTNEIESNKLISSAELVSELFFELKKKALNPNFSGLTSGFYDLDALTQGFQNSDLIILAGRPSMGKTALALNIVINTIKEARLPILFFSLEMSKIQIMYRILGMETNINQTRLRSGKLSQMDWIKLNRMMKIISKFPLFIDDSSNLSIQDIRLKIKTILFEQGEVGLIIIDYLQLMQGHKNLSNSNNRVQEISQITRSLKILAREFNVPILVLSQLSRNVENRVDKKPILSDLRESGSIEQDADIVLMLYRNQYYNIKNNVPIPEQFESENISPNYQPIELILAKQRNGPIGTVKLNFDEKRTKFLNLNDRSSSVT